MSSNLKWNVNKMGTRQAAHFNKCGWDQQITITMCARPAAYYELLKSKMMNNQVGDNSYDTSVWILTLFVERTRIPQS